MSAKAYWLSENSAGQLVCYRDKASDRMPDQSTVEPLGLAPLLRVLAVLVTCLLQPQSTAIAQEASRPVTEEQVAQASDEGQLSLSSFRKPAGWSVSLFAAEPNLANPVAFFVDARGRAFVCESFRQDRGVTDNRKHDKAWLAADLAANSVQDREAYHQRLLGDKASEYTRHDERIRLIEDVDGDGKADRARVFASGFNQLADGTGAGVLVRGDKVYYTCIPKLWQLEDADGNGELEVRKPLYDGFGVRVAFRGHDLHGLIIGPDGRLYFSIGDRGYNVETPFGNLFDPESGAVFCCELDGSNLEVIATGLRNPQELAFDDYGNLFTGDNNSDSGDQARWVNVLEGGDSGWRMMYQYISDRGPFNRENLWRPYSAQTPAYIVPPIANIANGPSGLACYPGTGIDDSYRNSFFLVDFRGGASNSGVRRVSVKPKGAFWELDRNEEFLWNILATDVDFGPDGAMWVSDWVNGWEGEGKGRLYRFHLDDPKAKQQRTEVEQLLANGMAQHAADRLGELLSHPDRRIRNEAQWELAARGDLVQFETASQASAGNPLKRLHAVWGLGQLARQRKDLKQAAGNLLGRLLNDDDPIIKGAASKAIGNAGLGQFTHAICQQIRFSEPAVSLAASLAAYKLRASAAIQPACEMLERNADADPALRHAGIMALAGVPNVAEIAALKNHQSVFVRIAAVVALRKRQHSSVSSFLVDADDRVRTEAARAIHDVPSLHSALPQLAALVDQPGMQRDLAHRVLNANFRLGQTEHARSLARFAAQPENSLAMRKEAIDMLLAWNQPGDRDRIMNRHMPLPQRDAAIVKQVFLEHIDGLLVGSEEIRMHAARAAASLGITQVAQLLQELVVNQQLSPEDRAGALEGFVMLRDREALPFLLIAIRDSSPTIRAKAMQYLVKLDAENSLEMLAKATHSPSTIERQTAWDLLATVENSAATKVIEEGLNQYLLGQLPDDVWLNVIEAAEGRVAKGLIQSLNTFERELASQDSLASYRDCISGGDAVAGEQLFMNKAELSCVRCHKVGDKGGDVGPVLTEIGKSRDARYLLESIVAPDAKLAQNYETIVILTDDDQIHTGILREEKNGVLRIITAQGQVVSIEASRITVRRKGKSSMPDDVLKFLTRRELRDLVAYLSSLKGN